MFNNYHQEVAEEESTCVYSKQVVACYHIEPKTLYQQRKFAILCTLYTIQAMFFLKQSQSLQYRHDNFV